jgi:L-asparagine transporter-like permease
MDKALKKTIVGLLLLSAIIFATGMVLFKTAFTGYYFGFFPFLILSFLIINWLFFISFHKSLKKSPNQFIRNFMASTAIKLVIYFLLVLSYMLLSPKTAVPFAVSLLIVYVLYTGYDLLVMLSLVKHRKENTQL